MENSNKQIVLKILEVIEYTDDKEIFANEFLKNVQMQSMADLLQSLAPEKQDELKRQFAETPNDPAKVNAIFNTHFSDEQMQKAFEDVSQKAVMEWMQTISPTLSDAQRQKLLNLSQEFNPTHTPIIT